MGLICSDLLVVELGDGCPAAAQTGMVLADNGARVIKVEAPGGDSLRTRVPSGWLVWNRGKESVVADLTAPAGQEAVAALVAGADVVVEAFDAGRAEAWGLGSDTLCARHPGLVYCAIKGFGPAGHYARIPADDALVMAKAGAFWRGDFAFRPGPIFSGARVASNGAANMAVAGIMAALVVRDRTGRGQRVDASLYQGLNPIDYFVSYHVQLGAKMASPPASAAPTAAASRRTPAATRYMVSSCTRDGRWLFFSPQLPHQAAALVKVLELDWMLADERFRDMPSFWTLEDADAWEAAIHERVKERDLAEWIERSLADDDLPFEAVLSAEEALDHPQMRANGNVVTVEDPDVGTVEEVGPVGSFSRTPSAIERSAPALGAHRPLPEPRAGAGEGPLLPAHALEGVTIVEFGYFYAMPFGVTMAAALGARVIKVESIEGDPMRWSFGPAEWGAAKTTEGKESICVDLGTDAGRAIMHRLLRKADVFVQGFRPGVDVKLGVDYDTVAALNPSIVYVHGAGYGQHGPYASRPIYAGTAAAAAGSVHRQAAYWLDPDLNSNLSAAESQAVVAPRMRNLTDGDANAAVGVLAALMLALRHRQRTGEGQFVGTSMVGGNVLAYADDFNRYSGKVPVRQADPEQLGLDPTYRLYRTAQGWVFLGIRTEQEWELAMRTAGRASLLADPRFATAEGREANSDALAGELEALFSERPATAWEELFLSAGVGCVAVTERSQAEFAVSDEHLRAMGLVTDVEHPLFGSLLRYAPPVALSATPGRVAPGCAVAQHTASILAELGYGTDEIEKLAADGVVRLAD